MDFLDSMLNELLGAGIILTIVAWLLSCAASIMVWLFSGYTLQCIGTKANASMNPIFAYIPIGKTLYTLNMTKQPWWKMFFFDLCGIGFSAVPLVILVFISPILAIVVWLVYMIFVYYITTTIYMKLYDDFGFNKILGFFWDCIFFYPIIAFSNSVQYKNAPKREPVPSGAPTVPGGAGAPVHRLRYIVGMSGEYKGAKLPLNDGEEIIFGRDSSICSIVFSPNCEGVSRKHCSVRFDPQQGCYLVVDYSTAGTFTSDGIRLQNQKPVKLKPGNKICLGDPKESFLLS